MQYKAKEKNMKKTLNVEFELNYRCRAFSGAKIGDHRMLVSKGLTVRVWDPIAGHYTLCHSISRRNLAHIVAKAVAAVGNNGFRSTSI